MVTPSKRRRWSLILCVLLSLWVWQPALAANEAPFKILTSIRPLALLVQDIVGDTAEVEVLLPGGASPHHYNLRVSDVRQIRNADIVIWLGPEFERFLQRAVEQRGEGGSMMLTTVKGLHWPAADDKVVQHHHDDRDGRDMHIWMDPVNGARLLDAIAARLSKLRPALAPQFSSNLESAKAELALTTSAVARELAPLSDHGFGVSHDGFRHFVDRFGLNQLAAVSTMPDQGVSARHMATTVKALQDARCLVVEAGDPPASVARLQRLFKLPTVAADPLALNPGIDSYAAFIASLGQSFSQCLKQTDQ